MEAARLQALVDFYQTLTPETVARFGDFYAEDARFKDPFNEVRGLGPIREIFQKMFRQVAEPRFVVGETLREGASVVLVWDMHFRTRSGRPAGILTIHGVSHLRFAEDGRVNYHRDYWDTGEELYAKLPGVGIVARFLRRLAG